MRALFETYNFIVVCAHAQQVSLMGDFNNWSTTATPMETTEANVWQLAVQLPVGDHQFSYFVIDQHFGTGRARFGSTYLLPGTWARVIRDSVAHPGQRSGVGFSR